MHASSICIPIQPDSLANTKPTYTPDAGDVSPSDLGISNLLENPLGLEAREPQRLGRLLCP